MSLVFVFLYSISLYDFHRHEGLFHVVVVGNPRFTKLNLDIGDH